MTRIQRLPEDKGNVMRALVTLMHAANDLAPADDLDKHDEWRALVMRAREEWDAMCARARRVTE